jgi:O-methyltransferase domain
VSTRVYGNWNSLTAALRTGQPQSGSFGTSGYSGLYAESGALETFVRAMTGTSRTFARALALSFPWHRYRTIIDIGTAEGCVPVEIARAHSHLTGGGYDLPAVEPSFTRYVGQHGLSDRLRFYGGDFHREPLPSADVLVMGRILHNWGLPVKAMLLRKAYAALPRGGVLIVCEALIDDARRAATDALLASLHMLIETQEGFEASGADYSRWLADAGFQDVRIQHLGCMQSAIIGFK